VGGANVYGAEPKPNWQSEWDKTVQAAKKEGKLSLYLLQGEGELSAVAQLFQKKYPEINVVTTPGRGNTLAPRIMAERRAGKYLVDAYISGVTTAYDVFYRAKILDSVRDALILPEVVDESKWWLGQHQYVDPENRYIFVYVGNVSEYVSYNTKLVQPGEIRSHWDFLNPKWKGKILSRDPRISGSQSTHRPAHVLSHAGVRPGIHPPAVRRDGHHGYTGNSPGDGLARQRQVRHLLFLFGDSEGEGARSAGG
jgi:hypothetical protein